MTDQLEELPLLEMLDHLLDRGVVIAGEAVISIGDVDLLYLGLNVVLANVDAIMRDVEAMKAMAIGAHLLRDDVEPVAEAVPAGDLFLSTLPVADDQPLGDRELLVRVAVCAARLLEVATFVAIRYGFTLIAPSDAEAKCAAHVGRWKRC